MDIKPTWVDAIAIYVIGLEYGTPEGKEIAREGLREIGETLDKLKAERESKE